MVNVILSLILMVGIGISAIALVSTMGKPVVDISLDNEKFRESERVLEQFDRKIKEVVSEGQGSVRVENFNFPSEFEVSSEEDSIQFSMSSSGEIFPFLSRKRDGSIVKISESDVDCYDNGNFVIENSHLKAVFKKIDSSNPAAINTRENIISLMQKDTGKIIVPSDSSIVIDDDPFSSAGTGYTELLKEGHGPVCTVHAFVNSTLIYDIYYKLYSGADFITVEVRNIR